MLKKLTEEKLAELLEAGIREFAQNGPERASMNTIAARAGISVGVLYKYYENKEAFFAACLERSLSVLEELLTSVVQREEKPLRYAELLIGAVQSYSRRYGDYVRMYHTITSSGNEAYAVQMAQRIEGISAQVYTQIIERAQRSGDVRADLDPRMFAFFFDNLLMMMQFSYSCPYYRQRFQIYCGDDVLGRDEQVTAQLLKFMESAFTLEQKDITHRTSQK